MFETFFLTHEQERAVHGFSESARHLLLTLGLENFNSVQNNVNSHIENILSYVRRREIGPVVRIFLTNSYISFAFVNHLDDAFLFNKPSERTCIKFLSKDDV